MKLGLLALLVGLLAGGFVLLHPADPRGIWASRSWAVTSDGEYDDLWVDDMKYYLVMDSIYQGLEGPLMERTHREYDIVTDGEVLARMKVFGPLAIVFDGKGEYNGFAFKSERSGKIRMPADPRTGDRFSW